MPEKIETFSQNFEKIPIPKQYQKYFNTRIDILNQEDGVNEGIIYRQMKPKGRNDYAEEYEEAIEKIFQGQKNNDEKVKKILAICSQRKFDISQAEQAKTEEEKGRIFWKIISAIEDYEQPMIKAESFKTALEHQKINGIKMEGFEKDKEFSGIDSLLKKTFSNGLLDKALISRISYYPEIVNISLNKGNYFLPQDKYFEWKKQYSDLPKHKVRAVNRGSSNRPIYNLFHSTPIEIYSFVDENLDNFAYLKDIPADKKMRLYKLGTIMHEVGHNLYVNLLNDKQKEEWKKIIDLTGSLTYYSQKYASGIHGNKVNYEEEFAEAIRLITTVNDYLKQNFPKVFHFIMNNFPEIKPQKL